MINTPEEGEVMRRKLTALAIAGMAVLGFGAASVAPAVSAVAVHSARPAQMYD